MKITKIDQTITLLTQQYGVQDCEPNGSPLDVLINTILSQNTSDTNSGRAFSSLKAAFPGWEAVAAAPAGKIAETIRVGGLDKIKSNRIKQVLSEIKRMRGSLSLDFLAELPIDEARAWLRRLKGVGAKTACCVLLFALCKPALPVDTHILRVSKRLGFIDFNVSAEKAHTLLEAMVPMEKVYLFHVLMIEHGRRICKAQRPHCTECVLAALCPSYEGFVGAGKNGASPKQPQGGWSEAQPTT